MSVSIAPPREIFAHPVMPKADRVALGSYTIDGFQEVTRSRDGEMLSIFSSVPVPRKGLAYAEATIANNGVKRITLSLFRPFGCKEMILPAIGFALTPFKWKISFLEKYLFNYKRLADSVYLNCERVPLLKYEYYINSCKALWVLTSSFLQNLGISKSISEDIGQIVATLFEFDDAYRIRLEDAFSEFTRQEVINNPSRFIDKFLHILKERDPNTVHETFSQVGKLLKFALYLPRIRKAFIKAFDSLPEQSITFKEPQFSWLKLDKYGKFWNLLRADYNIEGRTMEDRTEEYKKLFILNAKSFWGKDIEVTDLNDGAFSWKVI